MSEARQALGRRGERLARHRLEATGYSVLQANYRAKAGEIDLIAEKGDTLVFVEVRTRTGRAVGAPEESLTPEKRAHLVDAAGEYLQAHQAEDREWRIDLVAIEVGRDGRVQRLDVVENAVEL